MKETVTKSSKKLLSIFLSVLMVLSSLPLASLAVFAAPEDNTVDEYVVTITHGSDIVENAEVKIGEQTETTNSEGKATFTDLPYADSVKMTVTATGYKTAEVTLVINEMTTFTSYDMQKVFTVSGRAVSNVGATLENLSVTAKDGDKNATVTVNGTNFSFTATEGNDVTYAISAKNHASSGDITINAISQDTAVGDVTLSANKQTVTVKLTGNGTAKINGSGVSSGNSVDIDFTNDNYSFKAEADKENGYHIEKITGAVSFAHANNASNSEKNEKTVHEATVTLDKAKTEDEINVQFVLNKYDVESETDGNGSMTLSENEVAFGSNVRVDVIPKAGYYLVSITANNKDNNTSTVYEYDIQDSLISDSENSDGKTVYTFNYEVKATTEFTAQYGKLNETTYEDVGLKIDDAGTNKYKYKSGKAYYYALNDSAEIILDNGERTGFIINTGYKGEDWFGEPTYYTIGKWNKTSVTVGKSSSGNKKIKNNYYSLELDEATIYGKKNYVTKPLESTNDPGYVLYFDGVKPTIADVKYKKSNSDEEESSNPVWHNNNVTVSADVSDDESGLKTVVISKDDSYSDMAALEQAVTDGNAFVMNSEGNDKYSYTFTEEEDIDYYIYACDNVGNINPVKVHNQIDKTKPIVSAIKFKDKKGNDVDFKEYGTDVLRYSSPEDVIVEIDVKDMVVNDASSSFKDVQVFENNGEKLISDNSAHKVTLYKDPVINTEGEGKYYYAVYRFTLKFGEHAKDWTKIKAQVTDNAGNVSERVNKTEAEQLEKQFELMLSDVTPMATIAEVQNCNYKEKLSKAEADSEAEKPADQRNYSVDENGDKYRDWYKDGDIKFNVVAKDNNEESDSTGPSLKSVKVYINGGLVRVVNYDDFNTNQKSFSNISIYDKTVNEDGTPTESDIELKEGKNSIKVEVTNNNTKSAEVYYYFYRDVTHPIFTMAEFIKSGSNAAEQILELLTFGVFSNDDVDIKLSVLDKSENTTDQSKVKEIELYNGDELEGKKTFDADKRKNKDEHTFTIKMNDGYIGNLFVKVTDSVGNVNYIDVDDETAGTGKKALETVESNSKIKSHYVVLENTKPIISSSSLEEPDNADANPDTYDGEKWYGGDVDLLVEYSDSGIYSGLYESSLTINEDYIIQNDKKVVSHRIYHEKASENDEKYEDVVSESSFLINTENASQNGDGSYNLKATVRDNAGNKGEDYEETFYIDRDAPYITNFEFVGDYQEIVDGKQKLDKDGKDAKVKNYGYYFNSPTTVTITASDDKGPSSGVREITLRFIDFNGKQVNEITSQVDVNNQCSFEIAKDFKGVIIACATDNVWHQGYFYTPDGVIYETNEPKIEFLIPTYKKNGNKTKEQAPYRLNKAKDSDDEKNTKYKNELFNADAYLGFDITDSAAKDSGIREISWEITTRSGIDKRTKGYKTILLSKGVRKVDNAGKLIKEKPTNNGKSKLYGEMKIDENGEDKTENNLVHHITGKFLIADDYNDIIVKLKVTDRAGNFKEESKVLSVDKTAPKITLKFTDNNKKTGKYAGYYNKDREAVVTVKERNFDPAKKENLNFIINNIDKQYSSTPDIEKAIRQIKNWSCSWKTKENKEHGYNIAAPDDSTYIYKFKFKVDKKGNGDGNYDLKFSLKDKVGNKSNREESTFILDGTAPSITVKFSEKGQSKKNPNYYNEDVTITATITEHFITPKECDKLFKNLIALQNNGDKKKKYKQPKFTSFKITGKDKFEATAVLKDNAKHSINMSIEDKAGNKFTLFEKKTNKDKAAEINVDHNKPEIKFLNDIEGLDKADFASYNKEQFTPVITITDEDGNLDTAIDSKSYVIRISGTRHQNESYDYFAGNSEEVDVKTVKDKDGNVKECTFTIKTFNPKTFKRDDVYVMNVIAVDKAGNEIKSGAQYFSINRYGSTYDYNLMSTNRNTEGSIFEDTLYTVPFVSKSNPITLFTEYNCDNIKEKKTQLKLVYTNTKQQTEKEMELVQGVHYKIIPALDNKKVFHTKAYSYQLVDEELFNEDGVYEIYAKTKDAAKNTNKNNVAVEKNDRTKKIIKFVVDNTAPRIDAKQSFEKIAYIDNDIYQIDTKSNKSTLKDDLFETDGKSCAFNIAIDEENLGLDAIDINDLKITIDKNPVNFEILSENKENVVNKVYEENGVYNAMIKIDAPADYSVNLVISLRDRAGNERIWKADELLISNNWFIRFIHNPLAVGITIGVIVLIAVGIALFIILKRRKERDDEE